MGILVLTVFEDVETNILKYRPALLWVGVQRLDQRRPALIQQPQVGAAATVAPSAGASGKALYRSPASAASWTLLCGRLLSAPPGCDCVSVLCLARLRSELRTAVLALS